MSLHEQSVGKSDEWYTPMRVFDAMGAVFDMDPCAAPVVCPASLHSRRLGYADGLSSDWIGFVWLNPPFGGRNGIAPWLAKFMAHGDGVALTPDRTSAPWWHDYACQADAILFVRQKIRFIPGPGAVESAPAQGTCLMAKGPRGVSALQTAAHNRLGLVMVRPNPHGQKDTE